MDETTTEAALQDKQAQDAQPVEQSAEAVTTTPSEPPATDQDSEAPAATADNADELSDFWAKKGIDISTPEGQAKAAKSYAEAERAMHAKSQQASELQKQMASQPIEQQSQDPMVQEALERAARAETATLVSQWKSEKGITPEQDQAIGKYVEANPDKGFLLKNGYLTLDDIYAMSGVGHRDTAAIEAQGGRKALEQLANKQRSTAPQAAAASGSASGSTAEDDLVALLLKD